MILIIWIPWITKQHRHLNRNTGSPDSDPWIWCFARNDSSFV